MKYNSMQWISPETNIVFGWSVALKDYPILTVMKSLLKPNFHVLIIVVSKIVSNWEGFRDFPCWPKIHLSIPCPDMIIPKEGSDHNCW